MEFDALRLLVDVARLRSFSQAAEVHGITQSAASQRVSHLEKHLGVVLIDRSSRPLGLTDAGRVYLEGATDVLDRLDRLHGRVAAIGEAPEGRLRVAAIYSAGIELLNRVGEMFEADRPKVNVIIDYCQPDEVYRQVLEGACDFGIISYPQRWTKVERIALRDEPMAVVSRPGHPVAAEGAVKAGVLGRWDMVTFDDRLPIGRAVRRYLREHGVQPSIPYSFDNIDTIKNAIAVTDRFSILPVRTVVREIEAGTLVVTALEPALTRPLGILHRRSVRSKSHANGNGNGQSHGNGHSNGHGSAHDHGPIDPATRPLVQAFIDYLLEHAGPQVDVVGPYLNADRTRAFAASTTDTGAKA
ncbi:MAG: LysR family transcriptional regulator [Planctomycetota bacterium]